MNKNQKRVVIGILLVLALMFLFPPWVYTLVGNDYPKGYGFILTPPDPDATIDFGKLFLQWMMALIVGVLLVLVVGKSKDQS